MIEIARQRLMEDRHQWCALPAGCDIGCAEIERHAQAETFRQRCTVADLHGQTFGGFVQHGLAVEADNGDASFVDMFGPKEFLDRLGMGAGDEDIGLGQRARPRVTVGQARALLQGSPQQGPFVV